MSKVAKAIASPFKGLVSMFRGPKATNRAANHITSAIGRAQAQQQPYMDTGTQANTLLQNKLSSGALGGTFSPGDLTADPGYKFNLAQGQQALDRRASAPGGGGYFSGQALKDAQRFGQGLADQTYNDAYNRWLGQQRNTYNILSGQQGVGSSAATRYGNLALGAGNTMADAVMKKENQRMGGLAGIFGG